MRLGFFTEYFTECFRDCSFWGCWEFFLLVLGLAAFVVVFEVILGCPFEFAGRRTRARVGEVGDRSICVGRLALADFGSVASLAPFTTTPILHRWTLLNGTELSGLQYLGDYVVLRLTKSELF